MQNSLSHLIRGKVEVDEFLIGGPEENKQGRSLDSKKHKVLMMVEQVKNKKGNTTMGRAYAKKTNGYTADDFRPIMQKYIDSKSNVLTDKWTGYTPLRIDFENLKQTKLDKRKRFPLMHIHIMNLKGWLPGIHHHCSKQHLQVYLD